MNLFSQNVLNIDLLIEKSQKAELNLNDMILLLGMNNFFGKTAPCCTGNGPCQSKEIIWRRKETWSAVNVRCGIEANCSALVVWLSEIKKSNSDIIFHNLDWKI